MSDTQDTLIERLHEAADRVAKRCMGHDVPALISIPRKPTDIDAVIEEAATALADRDAKIADMERELDEALDDARFAERIGIKREVDATARAEAAESQVAELTQKLERATALVAKFVRCNDEGPGLIDCIDNDGERYTSQFLSDTVREARALNSGASQNG